MRMPARRASFGTRTSHVASGPVCSGRNVALPREASSVWPEESGTETGVRDTITKAEVLPLAVKSTRARRKPPRTGGETEYDAGFPGAPREVALAFRHELASGAPRHRTAAFGAPSCE